MSDTIQDLYNSFSEQMEPIQEDDRYFRYLFEMAQAADTTIDQTREELVKVVDEEWIGMIEDSLDAINTIIEKPRRFITTEEEVVPVSLAKKISADSVRHLSQNTQFLAPSDDGGVHPTKILNVNTVETYDLYENRFIYHMIQRLLTFVDKRTDVIFWSTGNEIRNRFKMHSKIDDAYEEIEYNVEMTVKNRQSFAENDADNMDVFMRIDRVRRLVMALRSSSFCQIMKGCSVVRSPIQRTNLIMKDPNYRKCYQLWQFMERYDKVGYNIDVRDSAMAFDDEYMVQMYTNLINNYTVFKSLTSDDRNLEELDSVEHEPVAPKFIKEIKEEPVDSPDLPDVEVRRVFVEEVTEAQVAAEKALEESKARVEELEGQLKAWKVQVNALTDERDDLADELDMAKTRETAATQRAQIAEADAEDLRGSLEDVEEGKKAAEKELAELRESSAAEIERMRSESDAEVAAAHADADARVAAAEKDAATARAAAESSAAAAKAAAEEVAARQLAQVKDAAAKHLADVQARAAEELAQVRDADAAALAAARDAAASRLTETKKAAEEELADVSARLEAAELKIEEVELTAERDAAAAKKAAEDAAAEAERKLEAVREMGEAKVAAAQKAADAAIDAARVAADSACDQATADATARVNAAHAERDAAVRAAEDARADADAKIAAAQEDAEHRIEEEVAAAKKACEEELERVRAEMQERISGLVHELEQTEHARDRAERRAEGNSLSRYLLAKLRGEEDPGVATGGESDGASTEGSDSAAVDDTSGDRGTTTGDASAKGDE